MRMYLRKKNWIALLLAITVLLSGLLVSCSNSDKPSNESSSEQNSSDISEEITQRSDAIYESQIVTLPTVENAKVYVGQSLSDITLSGGEGSVAGTFFWQSPSAKITGSGSYSVAFIPDDTDYSIAYGTLTLDAEQLTVTVSTDENGTADPLGTVNVNYGDAFGVTFKSDLGYVVDSVTLDGVAVETVSKYTIPRVTENHSIHAAFRESDLSLAVTCIEGTEGCYSMAGSTLTFTSLSENSVYSISGEMIGNIVIDVGDDYKFELEMQGFTLWCEDTSPISIVSGDKVTLTAKKNYDNYVYDLRAAVAEDDETQHSAAIYATVDLNIGGKGSLTVESKNNNGIHTKDDLEVKNLTLTVTCTDNALKGNDSVTVKGGTLTLIATAGDGIKTSNTDISSKGNQRGIVTISGGTIDIYAARDGIDAAYDVVTDESESAVVLNIYTDKYSEYSEDVAVVSGDTRYIRFTNRNYSYSILYYNSDEDYKWVNAKYSTSVSGGRTTYYYYSFPIEESYGQFRFFMYSSVQAQGQDEDYTVSSELLTWNSACDTFALSQSGSYLQYSWTNYTTSSGMGGMGGMQDGNKDKNEYSSKGIKAGNAITVNAGTIFIKSYDDAIHANNDTTLENGEKATGNVNINGGTLTLYSNDDGIHADGMLTVSDGTVNITKSYEGLEGTCIYLNGGNISIVSSDDGVNATATSGTGITLNGGTVYVCVGGDGFDANSRTSYSGIVFAGGQAVIICTSNNNSAIDTENGYQYKGGTVIALMPSGGMSGESKNCSGFSSIATSKTISLSSGAYLTVSSGSDTVVTVKMPCNLSALAIYLGSNGASISSASSSSATLDANGVCWTEN